LASRLIERLAARSTQRQFTMPANDTGKNHRS
jgi:hypothetical protein